MRTTKLKTKLGSCLLAVCMLTGMLPATAQAEEPHSHMLCGGSTCTGTGHTCTAETTFTEWTDTLAEAQNGSGKTAADSLPKAAGTYYLTQDVTLSATWEVTAEITLCLNGKTVKPAETGTVSTSGNLVTVQGSGAKLTLTDCDPSGNGKLDACSKGRVICVGDDEFSKKGELNLYRGNITGGKVKDVLPVNGSDSRGGGIYIGTGTSAVMYGGRITKNVVARQDSSVKGGGVFVLGSFRMYGGEIKGNSAGETYAAGTPNNQKVAEARGGGVALGQYENSSFTMCGGSITENAVYDGQMRGMGGGVYVSNFNKADRFHVSGNAVISGNQQGSDEKPDNVFLEDAVLIRVDSPGLGDNARIGVTLYTPPEGTTSVSIVFGVDDTCKGKFFSDADGVFCRLSAGS